MGMKRLDSLRQEVDAIDSAVLDLLAKRNELVSRIAVAKAELGLESAQPERYRQMLERLQEYAGEKGINPELVENVWNAIHEDSVAQQNQALGTQAGVGS